MAGIWEGVMLAAACSVDAFAASFSYGSRNVRIPVVSGLLIALICTVFLGGSLLLGDWLERYMPRWLSASLCFGVLFALGVIRLLDSIFGLFPASNNADKNGDMVISPLEASLLSIGISMDGLAVGFGAGVGNAAVAATVMASAAIGTAAVIGGCRLGRKISRQVPFNISWVSGVILIALAFARLF